MFQKIKAHGRIFKNIFQVLIVCGLFFFLGFNLYKSWNEIKGYDFQFNYGFLVLSICFMLLLYAMTAVNYYFLLKKMGLPVTLRKVTKARIITDIMGYIPGKVWTLLGRFYYLNKGQITKMEISVSTVIEFIIMIVSGSIIAVALILITGMDNPSLQPYYYMPIASIFVLLILIHPKIITFIVRKFEKIFKIPNARINLRYKDIIFIISLYIPYWLAGGLMLFFLISSLTPVSFASILQIIGIYAASCAISIVTFIAPAGLGIREGIMSFLLAFYIPLPIAIIISILLRVIFIIIGSALALMAKKL